VPGSATILDEHLRLLSIGYPLSISDDKKWLLIHEFKLPPGYNRTHTDVLVEIPADYPLTPPGVASRAYLAPDLRHEGRVLQCFYVRIVPGWGKWGWLCYRGINWNPCSDSLVTLMEMFRADLTDPAVRELESKQ
jgi:hypothetical protein